MNAVGRLVAATVVLCAGLALLIGGLGQRRPSLAKVSAYLDRAVESGHDIRSDVWHRFGRLVYRGRRFSAPVLADLRLVHRQPETHAAYLVALATMGLLGPTVVVAIGQLLGVVSLGATLPVVVTIAGVTVAPLVVHSTMRSAAAEIRRDMRHQLSAYLDVVTMLLAGNVGNEGALRQAAHAGDGRLFVELRRQILITEASNRSLVSALALLGEDLELVELQQVAASAALGATAGAPVARSLAAKCATLRSALASEQEAEARVRTGKITVPLVGMSLLIMAAVIYPALYLT
jgi:Flp pilus assembly protein TadB